MQVYRDLPVGEGALARTSICQGVWDFYGMKKGERRRSQFKFKGCVETPLPTPIPRNKEGRGGDKTLRGCSKVEGWSPKYVYKGEENNPHLTPWRW